MKSTRYALGSVTAIDPVVRVQLDGHDSDVPAGLVEGSSVNIGDRVNVVIRTPLKPLILGRETFALDPGIIPVTQAEFDAQLAALTPADIGAASAAALTAEAARATAAEASKLAQTANLSDVASPTTARASLGLGTAATVDTGTTAGQVPVLGTGGRLAIARIAAGTPDGTQFVRDDGTLAAAMTFATAVKWGA